MEEDSPVRAALDSLRACPPLPPRTPSNEPPGAAASLAFLVGTVLVVVLAVSASARNTTAQACRPITYAFVGAPPADVRQQFHVATDEIGRMTGLRFAPADSSAPRMTVAWVANVHASAVHASNASGRSTVVGSGFGRWHTEGVYRVLDGAGIEVNARWDWSRATPGSDNLRAVLVHELGHVVGLSHSADPGSYMFPRTRPIAQHWTAQEQQQLKAIGANAGCS